MPKKAAIKKAPVKKAATKKKAVVKKVVKKPIKTYEVWAVEDGINLIDKTTYNVGDTVNYKLLNGNECYVTIKGIYTDGKSIKYHLNNSLYVTEDKLIPF